MAAAHDYLCVGAICLQFLQNGNAADLIHHNIYQCQIEALHLYCLQRSGSVHRLLQLCGPWPMSVAQEKPELTYPLAFEHPGSLTAEAKHGEVTLCRFDGDNGEYSLLLGNAKGVDGPKGMGTYLWVEVENIKRLEAKIVEGPYIHHCVGIHKNVVPVLYEACKYIGVKPDLYDPIEEDVKAYLRGE